MEFIDHAALGLILVFSVLNHFKLSYIKERLEFHRDYLKLILDNLENPIKKE